MADLRIPHTTQPCPGGSHPARPHDRQVPDPAALAEIRRAAGYTQTALADEIGVTASYISQIESGAKSVTGDIYDSYEALLDRHAPCPRCHRKVATLAGLYVVHLDLGDPRQDCPGSHLEALAVHDLLEARRRAGDKETP